MTEPTIKEKFGQWSLGRVEFLLSHIEGFVEDEDKEVRQRAVDFTVETGLEKVESLIEVAEPNAPELAVRVLERLSAFFDAGLLVLRGPAEEHANWWVTDLFWRGNLFHLTLQDQVLANRLIPEVAPLQVQRTQATKMLSTVNLNFLSPRADADAFLLKPTPTISYVLLSNLGAPWSPDHMAHTQRLVNKCFVY